MRSVLALLLMAAVFLAANSVADPQPHASAGRLEINPRLAELKTEVAIDIEGRRDFTQQMVNSIFSFSELGFQEYETQRYATVNP